MHTSIDGDRAVTAAEASGIYGRVAELFIESRATFFVGDKDVMGQEIFQNSTDLNRLKTLTMPTGGNAMRLTKEVNN